MEHDVLTTAELVRTHQAGVWRYVRFLGATAAEADDLTQETFLAVIRRPFEQRSSHETAAYLRVVARRQLLMLRRRQGREPDLIDMDEADTVFARLAPSGGGELLDALEDCLEGLNGKGRQAVDLAYRQGYSRAEMAERMGITNDAVKAHLQRARASLRKCIEGKVGQGSP